MEEANSETKGGDREQASVPPPTFDGTGQFTVAFLESEGQLLFPSGCAPGVVYGLLCTDCVEIHHLDEGPNAGPNRPNTGPNTGNRAYAATFAFVPFARAKTDPKSGLLLPGGR